MEEQILPSIEGTNGFDYLISDTSQTEQVIYGYSGTDVLKSVGALTTQMSPSKILIGGSGDTIYEIADNSGGFIVEHQNSLSENNNENDYDIISTTNFGSGIDIDSNLTIIAELENKHLIVLDTLSQQSLFLYDWQEPDNRIEEFYFKDQNLTYDEFAASYRNLNGYERNIAANELGTIGEELEPSIELLISISDLGESLNTDITEEAEDTVNLYRFSNDTFNTGTYLFVDAAERDNILIDRDLNQSFKLEGEGNYAFQASTVPADNLEPFYRLRNRNISGTYIFVGETEYDAIFAESSSDKNSWIKEGFDDNGRDIPDFYLYGVGAGEGTQFYRLQNNQNGTFLFASSDEVTAIENDPLLSASFTNQGLAFESLV